MNTIDTLIVGAGQAGLALSRHLTDRGREHVLLERGRIAERWRSQRWDSLRLLTPNWMSRLPGQSYAGPDPDGFMGRDEVIAYLDRYARSFQAPVEEETTVRAVRATATGWLIETDRGSWLARNVVIATGHCDTARIPSSAAGLASGIHQVTTTSYRNPTELPGGGVLVVGASASGAQLADEIRASGREVMLAVGHHNRLPRRYRGRDIMWWLDRLGVLDRDIDTMPDPGLARREPSLQLVGREQTADLDLGILAARSVRLAGRFAGADGWTARFDDDLAALAAEADDRLARLLRRIDAHVAGTALARDTPPAEPHRPLVVPPGPREVDLRDAGIETVLWATGYVRRYPWLHADVFDGCGEIRHRRGRTAEPGLFVLGLQFMTRRRSSFLDGVGRDAAEIAEAIAGPPTGSRAAA